MTNLTLVTKLAEAMEVAIGIRDGERPAHHAVIVVGALNVCMERVIHDDLAAAGVDYSSMTTVPELVDFVGAEHPSPPGRRR
jgi:hypothetical protein